MSVYLIGYDLRHQGIASYEELFKAIRSLSGGEWWHCLDSTWLIDNPGSADRIWRSLIPHMHRVSEKGGDKLFVVKVTNDAQWTISFPEDCHEWLRAHLS